MATSSSSLPLRTSENVDMACNNCLSPASTVERGNLSDAHLLSNCQQNGGSHLEGEGPLETQSSELVDKGVTIDDLPDEVMLEIFSYVSFSENINILQKVCTRWKFLAQDAHLWYHFKYIISYDPKPSDEEIIATFAAVPQLRTVIMEDDVSPRVLEALPRSCPHLTTLQTRNVQAYSEEEDLFDECKKIHSLTTYYGHNTTFIDAVARLADLRVLHLCSHYDGLKKAILLRGLADGCPHLCDLRLPTHSTVCYSIGDAEYFLSSHQHVLRRLCIGWTSVEGRCITPLLVKYAGGLESLELTNYDVIDYKVGVEALTALGQLHNLRELSFGVVQNSNARYMVPTVFENGNLSKLQKLCLRDFVPDAVTRVLAHHCPELRELKLYMCDGHTDELFKPLRQLKKLEILKIKRACRCLHGEAMFYISKLPALHSLTIGWTKFDYLQPSLDCILEMCGLQRLYLITCICWAIPFDKFPGKLVNLRELELDYCDGDQAVLDRMAAQMPDLRIEGTLGASFTDNEV